MDGWIDARNKVEEEEEEEGMESRLRVFILDETMGSGH